jgi:excisionase family DNA binding protein
MRKTILSTVDVARLFNVTETTVKRWADDGQLKCQKTPGGHRKFPVKSIVEFAERNKFEPVGTLSLPNQDGLGQAVEMAILNRDFPILVNAFVEKALSPDRMDLYVFFSYLYEHRVQIWEIHDLVIRPGMEEIGERWKRGDVSVSHEHRASYETLDAMAKLQAEIFMKPRTQQSVLLACVGEDLHEIGLRCAGYLFESEGWDIHYLGARTPVEEVIWSLKEVRPAVVALSVTNPQDHRNIVPDLKAVNEAARASGSRVVVGGNGVPPESRKVTGVDVWVSSSRELLEFIGTMAANQKLGKRGKPQA